MKNLGLILTLFFVTSSSVSSANFFESNVNTVKKNHSYENDFDSSKFRMKIYKSSPREIIQNLRRNPLELCATAKTTTDYDKRSSAHYLLSILKRALAVDPNDKDYSFKEPTYFWEQYLTYRNFVDISQSFVHLDSFKLFKRIPEGVILLAESGCVPNGAVALLCPPDKLFSTRFPNFKKLREKLNDPKYPQCKIGKGLKLIVEAERFKELNYKTNLQ